MTDSRSNRLRQLDIQPTDVNRQALSAGKTVFTKILISPESWNAKYGKNIDWNYEGDNKAENL